MTYCTGHHKPSSFHANRSEAAPQKHPQDTALPGASSKTSRFLFNIVAFSCQPWSTKCYTLFHKKSFSAQGAKTQMTYVVAEPCVNCRYTDCALVCPVEAFHLDDDMLVINPETCIDCDACVPECPVEAVFAENAVPAEWTNFTAINSERSLSGLPTITARLDPLCE